MAMKKINKTLAVSAVILTLVSNTPTIYVSAENKNNNNQTKVEVQKTSEGQDENNSSKSNTQILEVNDTTISMTAEDVIQVKAVFDYKVDIDDLKWYLGDKEVSEWKTWNDETESYSGDPFITVKNLKVEISNGTKTTANNNSSVEDKSKDGNVQSIVTADIKVGLLYNSTNGSSHRSLYPELINNYDLKVEDTSTGKSFKNTLKLNIYDSYKKYDELKPEIDKIFENANDGMYLNYESYGKSVENRDMHMVTLAKDKESVDKYLNELAPLMLENPAKVQEMVKNGELEGYKVPIFLNNVHADEAPGVDSQLDLLRKLATEENITFKTLNENKKEIEVTLNVEDLLEDVIFVMSLTDNPDGRFYNTRQNINGFDLNRDTGYQTQIESQQIVEQIVKWNPIAFMDLHGFVEGFLIEPCTPPHDPNYEYDLIAKNSLGIAKAMGDAAISNTKYDSYEVPLVDYDYVANPDTIWDDATPAYTGTYALHHGAMSSTVEVPELNQDSTDAFVSAILGAAHFVSENKDELFTGQLEYYKRGVNGEDNKAVDKYFVNASGEVVGRDRGDNENFFPEYYVLPIDKKLQKNASEVHNTVDYLIRNGVKVSELQKDTKVGDITYPKGSYVVDMHQAKRGYANTVLYQGSDESDFKDMYAEIVMNFPDTRGFNEYEVRTEGAFDGKLKQVSKSLKTGTKVDNKYKTYVIKNTNNDVIKAVNELLNKDKDVKVIAKDTGSFEEGEYIVSSKDLKEISSKYTLEIEPLNISVEAKTLELPKVFATGSYGKFVLEELGFSLAESVEGSDIIVDDKGDISPSSIKDGIDYLGIGTNAVAEVGAQILPGLTVGKAKSRNEGLMKAEYFDDVTTGGYDEEEYLYTANGSWIEEVPEDVKVIAKVSEEEDFYVAGWWPENSKVKGKTMGVTTDLEGEKEGSAITLFANTLTNKAHPQNAYRLIANTIFNSIDSEITTITPESSNNNSGGGSVTNPPQGSELTDTNNHWAEKTILSFVDKKYVQGYPDNTFKPDKTISRAEFVKIINKIFGYTDKEAISFKDMDNKEAWYYDEVAIAVKAGYINGYEDNTFKANQTITREEAAKIIASVIELKQGENKDFKDSDTVSSWAKDAMELLTSNNIIGGYEDNTIKPKGNMTRAEAVTVLERSINK